ncbi:MAG: hypothetical protein M1837_004243 [Sclerophora amabilis]|nr:MAG: hypothetical protein M1837_004243 [Sclerophora amabilis]
MDLRATGGMALIALDARNTIETGQKDIKTKEVNLPLWHSVAVLRKGAVFYVFDGAFNPKTEPGYQLGDVPGLRNVGKLMTMFKGRKEKVEQVQITGCHDLEFKCLALACQWMLNIGTERKKLEDHVWYSLGK